MKNAWWVLVGLALSGCSGSVSGTVYDTNGAGAAVRKADQAIVLVAATPDFEAGLKKALPDFQAAIEHVKAEEKAATEQENAASYPSAAYEEAHKRWQDANIRGKEIEHKYNEYAVKMIEWGKIAFTRTDANGRYEFKKVKRGRYYLYTEQPRTTVVHGTSASWLEHILVPVEVNGRQIQDISPTTPVKEWPYSAAAILMRR